MLLLQARKLRPKLAFFLFCHRRLGRAAGHHLGAPVAGIAGKFLWIIAFWPMPDKPAPALHSGDFLRATNGVCLYVRTCDVA